MSPADGRGGKRDVEHGGLLPFRLRTRNPSSERLSPACDPAAFRAHLRWNGHFAQPDHRCRGVARRQRPDIEASDPVSPSLCSTSRRLPPAPSSAGPPAPGKRTSSSPTRWCRHPCDRPVPGGSGLGLDAASGVQACLRERGIGFAVGTVPIRSSPRRSSSTAQWRQQGMDLSLPIGNSATRRPGRAGPGFDLGTAVVGYGVTTVQPEGRPRLRQRDHRRRPCGRRSRRRQQHRSAIIGDGPHFWAAALEEDSEFGGLGHPNPVPPDMRPTVWKGGRNRPPPLRS